MLAESSLHLLLPDIGIAILAATLLGLAAHFLRQPIILGYLIAGAVVGPIGLKLIHGEDSIEVISEMGLILLLFIIGLEMNVKAIIAAGRQLLVAGFGQFPICVALGLGLFGALGYGMKGSSSDGLYLALMCALSSTAVVVKLLYDKAELDTLPGRMTLGILVIQDIYAIFILAFQPNFANPTVGPIVKAVLGTVALLVVGFLFSKFVLQRIFVAIAKSPEMVVGVAIGWCAAVAGVAGMMGLSKEMGALVAGLSIVAFPYSIHITAKTLPLRDFFLTLFFVSLGMKITAPRLDMIIPVVGIILFVIVSRFLSVYPLLALAGAGRRTAFITSLNLSQISEFSLVIASLGVASYNHISQNTVALAIYAMAIMAVMSSYAIRYNHQLYLSFDTLMRKLRPGPMAPEAADGAHADYPPIALLGFHRAGRALVDALSHRSPESLAKLRVIDFNTETLNDLKTRGIAGMFGDISSLDTLEHSHLHGSKMIVCTIPDMLLKGTDNQTLVKICRTVAPHAQIVATADDDQHEKLLRAEGATFVINPNHLAADLLASLVTVATSTGRGPAGVAPPPRPIPEALRSA